MAKYADKYESEQDLEKGFRDLDKLISSEMGRPPLADTAVLVGDNGMFKTHADLAASYVKMATAHGKIKAPPPPPPKKEESPSGSPKIGEDDKKNADLKIGGTAVVDDDADADAILDKAGLRKSDLVAQWDAEGKLTDAQYAAIANVRPGLGKTLVNQLARGMAAESALRLQVHNESMAESEKVVGGKAQLDTLLRIEVPKFLPKDQWQAFDKMLSDPKTRVAAVKTLATMHAEAVGSGKAAPIAGGKSAGGGSIGGKPTTQQELAKLMRSVQNGDQDAIAVLNAMKPDEIEKLQYV